MEHYKDKNISFLTFMIDREIFAIEVTKVVEVLRKQEIFMVPKTEKYVKGIINFRGDMITVVSTREKLNLSSKKNSNKYVIMILDLVFDGKNVKVGAMVDKVINVVEITEKEIKPVPEFGNSYNPKFLKGAFKKGDNFIINLDIEKIFSSADVEILAKVKEKNQ